MADITRRARLVDNGQVTVWDLKEWVDRLVSVDGFSADTVIRIGRASAAPFIGVIIVEEK